MNNIGYSRYDEPYDDYDYFNDEYVHVDEVDEIRQQYVRVLELIYGKGSLEDLNEELIELSSLFDVSFPQSHLNVVRKPEEKEQKESIIDLAERMKFHCDAIDQLLKA